MKTIGIRSIVSEKFVHRKSTMSKEEKALIVNLIKNLVKLLSKRNHIAFFGNPFAIFLRDFVNKLNE